MKKQRYRHTKSEEHRWYRVKLSATPVFAPPKKERPPQAGSEVAGTDKGIPTVHVVDIGRDKRDSLLAALSFVRALNGSRTNAAEAVESVIARFTGLSDDPYLEKLAGDSILLGTTVEPVTVVDYSQRYYVNSGRSLGASKVNVKLAEDGTLTNAEADVAGSLREVTGAISDIATPTGGILSGVAAIRDAPDRSDIRASGEEERRLGYTLEVMIVEAGYRDDYTILSDSSAVREITRMTLGVSHTRRWFEGGGPKAGDEKAAGPTIDFHGSVKLPDPGKPEPKPTDKAQ